MTIEFAPTTLLIVESTWWETVQTCLFCSLLWLLAT